VPQPGQALLDLTELTQQPECLLAAEGPRARRQRGDRAAQELELVAAVRP